MKPVAKASYPGSRNLGGLGIHFKEYCYSLCEQEPRRTWSTGKILKEESEHMMLITCDCKQRLVVGTTS